MEPRLKKSVKWTDLPKEYQKQIRDVFQDSFKSLLGPRTVDVQGRIYPSELLIQVGLKSQGRLAQENFEASMEYDRNKDNLVKLIELTVDGLASMVDQKLRDSELDMPREWQEFEFEKKSIFLRFSTNNTDLEKKADDLLGLSSASLVQGEDPDEELEASLKSLGLKGTKKIH